jgi:hypothetical protein
LVQLFFEDALENVALPEPFLTDVAGHEKCRANTHISGMSRAFVSAGKGELTGGRRRRRDPRSANRFPFVNATTVSFEVRTISGSRGGQWGG